MPRTPLIGSLVLVVVGLGLGVVDTRAMPTDGATASPVEAATGSLALDDALPGSVDDGSDVPADSTVPAPGATAGEGTDGPTDSSAAADSTPPPVPDRLAVASAAAAAVAAVPGLGGDPPPPVTLPGPHVEVIGDSIMAWNRGRDADVGSHLARGLAREVANRSVSGAVVMPRSSGVTGIPGQRDPDGPHGWVVFEGGANDLALHCGVPYGSRVLDLLVSSDGTAGRMVELTEQVLAEGRHVVLVSYYRTPARSRLTQCGVRLQSLEDRLRLVADRLDGVVLVTPSRTVAAADEGLFDDDATHPRPTASRRIAQLVADAILASEATLGPPPLVAAPERARPGSSTQRRE